MGGGGRGGQMGSGRERVRSGWEGCKFRTQLGQEAWCFLFTSSLENETVVLVDTQRVQGGTHGLKHRRRSAEQVHLPVGHVCLHRVRRNVAGTLRPVLRCGRQNEPNVHLTRTLLLETLKLLLVPDVLVGLVGVDEVDLRLVRGVGEDGLQHLQTRRQAGTSGNHAEAARLARALGVATLRDGEATVSVVLKLALGTRDGDRVADLHVVQVLRHLAVRVHLHCQLHPADELVAGHRRVRAGNNLVVDGGRKRDVLADGQTQNIRGVREGEHEHLGVGGKVADLDEFHVHLLLLALQRRLLLLPHNQAVHRTGGGGAEGGAGGDDFDTNHCNF
eukprot:Rhum_TRINITY_DN16701_c0_g1::Rhum_TRINITY_DN16701_c0_g1_i1::g.164139::m.164139